MLMKRLQSSSFKLPAILACLSNGALKAHDPQECFHMELPFYSPEESIWTA